MKAQDHLVVSNCPGFVVEYNIFKIIGDGSHDTYLSHAGIDFCYEKRPEHLKSPTNAICITKRKKLIKSSYMVLNLKQALFTYVFRLVSSITKKIYELKPCSNFYRDCHLYNKLF